MSIDQILDNDCCTVLADFVIFMQQILINITQSYKYFIMSTI